MSRSRYRFPGRMEYVPECCNKSECGPYTIIRTCPRPPYIRDDACNPNIYDRAIIRHTPHKFKNRVKSKFLLETFSNLILCPVNLHQFCGYDFKDGEIVAVEAENLSQR